MVRPHFLGVVPRYEHDDVALRLGVHFNQMFVEILPPKVHSLIVIVEEGHTMALQKPCDHFNIGPILACERKRDLVVCHGSLWATHCLDCLSAAFKDGSTESTLPSKVVDPMLRSEPA